MKCATQGVESIDLVVLIYAYFTMVHTHAISITQVIEGHGVPTRQRKIVKNVYEDTVDRIMSL